MADDWDPGANATPFGPQGGSSSPAPAAEEYDPGTPSPLKTAYQNGAPVASFGRSLGLGARDVIEGGLSLPMTALDIGTYLGRGPIRAAGGSATAPSDMLHNALTYIGLPEAATPGEKFRSEVARGGAGMIGPQIAGAIPRVAAAVPTMLRSAFAPSPGAAVSPVLPATQVAAGAAGGGAGEIAAEVAPESLKPAARLAGNIVGAGGVTALSDVGGKLLNAIRGLRTPIADAYEQLRIFPRTAGAVTENPTTRSLEAGATKMPFAIDRLQPAQRDTSNQFHNAVEDTARMLGGERTAQEAGGSVQQILQDWHGNTFPRSQDAVWNPLNQRLAGAAVDPSAYRRALQRLANPPELGGMTETQRLMGSNFARERLAALNADLPPGSSMTWGQAQALRRQIGADMGTPDIINSVGTAPLRSLYASLAEDIGHTATAHGQGRLFREANQTTIDAHNFIDNTLVKAIKARNPGQESVAPDAAARALLESNSAMQELRARVPQAADALAAYQLRKAVLAKAGQQGATDVPSAGTFLTTMRGQQMDKPEGTAALYNDPEVARNLRALLTVAGNVRETERLMNTSNTSSASQALQVLSAPARWAAGGYYGGPVGLAASVAADVTPYAGARALTSRPGIRWAGTPAGPRLPLDPKVAGLLGYLANQ
jgi:hypothetical protein